jgi:hypothetical protein
MAYIKITNGTQEPYSISKLRRDNPNTSFPKVAPPETLARYDVFSVVVADAPVYDKASQAISRNAVATNVGGQWTYEHTIRDKTAAEFEVSKTAKLAKLATIRWNAEESGTTFGGNPLATDRTTQAKLTAAYTKAAGDPDYVIANWKFAQGVFASLDAATIIAAANAVEAHIQACFTNEASLSAEVLGTADFAALEAVDLTVGW